MAENAAYLKLPDLLAQWPWVRKLSPHYLEVRAETTAWIQSVAPFEPRDMQSFLDYDFSLTTCLGWPNREKDFLRGMTDLMYIFFVFDEYTDVADKNGTQKLADICMGVLGNPDAIRPGEEHIFGKIMQQFWQRALTLVEPDSACIQRFVKGMEDYVFAVVIEAEDRQRDRIRSVEDYLVLRRGTSAAKAVSTFTEFGLGLPVEVMEHPALVSLSDTTGEMILIDNDIGSYFFEVSRGVGGHNLVTAVMLERGLGISEAIQWLEGYHKENLVLFLSELKRVPSWDEETDKNVAEYIDSLGCWVRGYNEWSFETKRYYGDEGLQVKEHRIVKVRALETGLVRKAN